MYKFTEKTVTRHQSVTVNARRGRNLTINWKHPVLLTTDQWPLWPVSQVSSPSLSSVVTNSPEFHFILNSLKHMTRSFLVSTINKDLETASVLVQRFLFRHWSWIIVTPEHSYHAHHSTLKNLICENTLMSFISPRWIVPLVLNWQNLFNILTFYSDLTHWRLRQARSSLILTCKYQIASQNKSLMTEQNIHVIVIQFCPE